MSEYIAETKVTLSIIVPVYNSEKYLSSCLESMICYDGHDLEIVLVNDGSSDGSQKIIEKYSKKYKFIKMVNKKNEGTYQARLDGVRNAQGDYVWFVDSDDWIINDGIKEMIGNINNDRDVDFYCFGMSMNGEKENHYNDIYDSSVILEDELNCLKRVFCSKNDFNSLCNKVIRKDIIINNSNITDYKNFCFGEDSYMTFSILDYAKKVVLFKKSYYAYRLNHGSMTHNFNSLIIPNNIVSGELQLTMAKKWELVNGELQSLVLDKFADAGYDIVIDVLKSCNAFNCKKEQLELLVNNPFFVLAFGEQGFGKRKQNLIELIQSRNTFVIWVIEKIFVTKRVIKDNIKYLVKGDFQ